MTIDDLLSDVRDELICAVAKFKDFNSAHEGHSILREEVDEMWEEIRANRLLGARREALQVAAMALRFLLDVRTQAQVDNTRDGRQK